MDLEYNLKKLDDWYENVQDDVFSISIGPGNLMEIILYNSRNLRVQDKLELFGSLDDFLCLVAEFAEIRTEKFFREEDQ